MSNISPAKVNISALLFDKDGTLFDFEATWNAFTADLLGELAQGDAALTRALAEAAHYDLETARILPTSPLVAGTNREGAELLVHHLPGWTADQLEHHMMLRSCDVPLIPPVPLVPLLDGFLTRGLALGVMTNDSEEGAHAHLGSAGVQEKFTFIAGFDSGFGAKPDPDPLLAFARATGHPPAQVAMVGDSTHDLIAGRRAGMQTVGVLTGLAPAEELAPHADVVLPDIGHLPAWLDG